jgi:hypothetical protein
MDSKNIAAMQEQVERFARAYYAKKLGLPFEGKPEEEG